MKNRMRKVIKVAVEGGHDVLMLGAFGCGVVGNDPQEVTTIERELLDREKFAGFFHLVVNPIAPAGANRTNFEAFSRVLGGMNRA
jgi:uncharacterized protein (TIGR02452 family)